MKYFRFFLIGILGMTAMSGTGFTAENSSPKKAVFMPLWTPQAQFAGYYVAYEKGFYKQHGIDLKIIPGGPSRSCVKMLEDKEVDFTLMWLSRAIQERAKGKHIVNIAQIVQRSALMIVAHRSHGIVSPKDLQGKKVGLWREDFSIQPRAFFKRFGLKVQEVPQSFSINLFLRGGVDAASAMWYNEYHTILNSGVKENELTTFFFYDYDLNFPEDGIYVREEMFLKDPELCRSFVQASVEGWQYAFSHSDETVDILLRYMKEAGVPANRIHQKWMLNGMRKFIRPDEIKLGSLDVADYNRVSGILKDNHLIQDIPSYRAFYRAE